MAKFSSGNGHAPAEEVDAPRFDAEPVNDDAVTMLAHPWRSLGFSDGTMYRVPRVPYEVGRKLSALQRQIVRVAQSAQEAARAGAEWEEPAEYWAALAEIRRIARPLLQPIGPASFIRRQLWRLRLHDPLAGRSEGEIATVAGFLHGLRMSRANPLP